MKNHLTAEHFQTEETAFAYVEARLWPNGPICHHCGETNRIGRLQGKTNRAGLYKCYACRKPFTVRMGTIFESSHVPLRVWLHVMYLACSSKKGISTNQLQRTLQCSMKTAWFLGHRVRECMKETTAIVGPIGGAGRTVEADETYIGGKPGNRLSGEVQPKQAVMSLVERDGRVRSFKIGYVDAANLHPIIAKHVHTGSRFITDEAQVYRIPGRTMADHQSVNHSAKEYVRGDVYTNSAEGYFSVLKRGIYGVYQHVSEAHLHRYLAEFDFRHSNRAKLGINDKTRADLALVGAKGKRLTYRSVGGAGAA